MTASPIEPTVYQGQFGEFTITEQDRREVLIYRGGLMAAAVSFAIGTGFVLGQSDRPSLVLPLVSILYVVFCVGLGISLWTIHIYMRILHRALQVFWGIGVVASLAIAYTAPTPFPLTLYQQPLAILGVGFLFAALTGIFFKEAFCFNRVETKLLTPLVPVLLLGHLFGWLSHPTEQFLLATWAVLFGVFALRKAIQPIPPDIGDKSVFAYLKQSRPSQS